MGVATEITEDTEIITAKAIGCRTTAEQRDLLPAMQPPGGNPRPSAHDLTDVPAKFGASHSDIML